MNTKIAVSVVAAAGTIVLFLLGRGSPQNANSEKATSVNVSQSDVVSQQGIHWHPELSITIKGEKQPIPAYIGIGMQYTGYPQYDPMMMMTDMHTHDVSGMIHWEVMQGPVKKEDIKLGQFFGVWGKKFTSSCIFDKCNGVEGRVTFKINGKENLDFENYLVQDKDNIEIIFE